MRHKPDRELNSKPLGSYEFQSVLLGVLIGMPAAMHWIGYLVA